VDIVFYDGKTKEWLIFNKSSGKTEAALPEEIDAQIDSVIDYLRNHEAQEYAVSDILPKAAQVAYKLIVRFGLPMTERQLISLIYLCDWRHCLTNDRQITEIKWVTRHGSMPTIGNNSPDLWASILSFDWANDRRLVTIIEENVEVDLERSELDAIAHCYGACSKMNLLEFTRLVCSTHPALTSNSFEDLDLVTSSEKYKSEGHWRPGIKYE